MRRITKVFALLLGFLFFTANGVGQTPCADAQEKFSKISAAGTFGSAWTDVQQSFGSPTKVVPGTSWTQIEYNLGGCTLTFQIGSNGRVDQKNFALNAGAFTVASPTPPNASSGNSANVAKAVGSLEAALAQFEEQIHVLEAAVAAIKTQLAATDSNVIPTATSDASVTPGSPGNSIVASPEASPANTLSTDTQKATTQAQKKGETDTGEKTASGQTIYEGPRGGRYHYSSSGKKVYERKK